MGFWTEVADFLGAMGGSLQFQMICRGCGTMCPERPHGYCGEGVCALASARKSASVDDHSIAERRSCDDGT